MYSKIISGTIVGIDGVLIIVEADIRDGLPMFSMVGYLASEVKEAKERVRTAIKNSGFQLPSKRITINLSPADMRKQGSAFDLPIAAAVLASLGVIPTEYFHNILIIGELGLNGDINPVNGVLSLVLHAKKQGIKVCIVPFDNSVEGALVTGIDIIGVKTLKETVTFLNNPITIEPEFVDMDEFLKESPFDEKEDFSDIKGQTLAKRGLEIAAAGMHNIMLMGPPGAGKSMMASRVPSILPQLSLKESLEITQIYSVCGLLDKNSILMNKRPFRSPHHTISSLALAGGGRIPRPGEISLAHKGVLFLDELSEYSRNSLEVLRQPLEERKIYLSRVHSSSVFPADIMLITAMNPCPCGYYPDRSRCMCTPMQIKRYRNRISQPLLDRIDMHVEVRALSYEDIESEKQGETSRVIRNRIEEALQIQKERYQNSDILFNSQIAAKDIGKYCKLGEPQRKLLKKAFENMGLSTRGYHRILKVARTIADLNSSEFILSDHIIEAISYRETEQRQNSWGDFT